MSACGCFSHLFVVVVENMQRMKRRTDGEIKPYHSTSLYLPKEYLMTSIEGNLICSCCSKALCFKRTIAIERPVILNLDHVNDKSYF